jgi:hypothetical protein
MSRFFFLSSLSGKSQSMLLPADLPAGLESDFTTASSASALSTSTATVAVNDQLERKHEGEDVVIDNLDRKHEGEDILISRSPSHDIEEAMHPCVGACPPFLLRYSRSIASSAPDTLKHAEFLKKVPIAWKTGPWSFGAIAWISIFYPGIWLIPLSGPSNIAFTLRATQ